jgi:hypothetical protein
MIHDIRFQENWDRIKNNKQKITESSNKRENLNIIKRKYNVGGGILLRKPGLRHKFIGSQGGSVYYIRSWDKCNG